MPKVMILSQCSDGEEWEYLGTYEVHRIVQEQGITRMTRSGDKYPFSQKLNGQRRITVEGFKGCSSYDEFKEVTEHVVQRKD
jgi:hypothetical protein